MKQVSDLDLRQPLFRFSYEPMQSAYELNQETVDFMFYTRFHSFCFLPSVEQFSTQDLMYKLTIINRQRYQQMFKVDELTHEAYSIIDNYNVLEKYSDNSNSKNDSTTHEVTSTSTTRETTSTTNTGHNATSSTTEDKTVSNGVDTTSNESAETTKASSSSNTSTTENSNTTATTDTDTTTTDISKSTSITNESVGGKDTTDVEGNNKSATLNKEKVINYNMTERELVENTEVIDSSTTVNKSSETNSTSKVDGNNTSAVDGTEKTSGTEEKSLSSNVTDKNESSVSTNGTQSQTSEQTTTDSGKGNVVNDSNDTSSSSHEVTNTLSTQPIVRNDQEATSKEYTLTRVGNIGVTTTPDIIGKHIDLWLNYEEIFLLVLNDFAKEFLLVDGGIHYDSEYTPWGFSR